VILKVIFYFDKLSIKQVANITIIELKVCKVKVVKYNNFYFILSFVS